MALPEPCPAQGSKAVLNLQAHDTHLRQRLPPFYCCSCWPVAHLTVLRFSAFVHWQVKLWRITRHAFLLSSLQESVFSLLHSKVPTHTWAGKAKREGGELGRLPAAAWGSRWRHTVRVREVQVSGRHQRRAQTYRKGGNRVQRNKKISLQLSISIRNPRGLLGGGGCIWFTWWRVR